MYNQWGQGYPGVDAATQAQQMYWQQYYTGYGAPQQYFGFGQTVPDLTSGQAAQALPTSGSLPTTSLPAGVNPVPPVEPPKEEPPPLPAEPPPPPEEEKLATSIEEQQKLSALQMQAAQWQQQKQWQEYQLSLVQYQQQLQQWTMQQASLLEQVNKEEAEFDVQYNDWLKQYNDWREQNKNHPNKEQYQQYEKQWQQYEEQMAQKREYIQSRKRALLASQQQVQSSIPPPPVGMPDMTALSAETKIVEQTKVAAAQAPLPPMDMPPPSLPVPCPPVVYGSGVMTNPMQQSLTATAAMGRMLPPTASVTQGSQYPGFAGYDASGMASSVSLGTEIGHSSGVPPPTSQGFPPGLRFMGTMGTNSTQQGQGPRFGPVDAGGIRGIRFNASSEGFGARPPFETDSQLQQQDHMSQGQFQISQGQGTFHGPPPSVDAGGIRASGMSGAPRTGPFGNRAPNQQQGARGAASPGQPRFGVGQSQMRPRMGLNLEQAAADDESWTSDKPDDSKQGFVQPISQFSHGGPRPSFMAGRFQQPGSGPGMGMRPVLRGPRPPENQQLFTQQEQMQGGFANEGITEEDEAAGGWLGEDVPEESDATAAFGQFGFRSDGSRPPGPGMQGRGMRAPFGYIRGPVPHPGDTRGPIPQPGDVKGPGPRFSGPRQQVPRPGGPTSQLRPPRPLAPWLKDAAGPYWGENEDQEYTEDDDGAMIDKIDVDLTNEADNAEAEVETAEDFAQEGGGVPAGGMQPLRGQGGMPPRFGQPDFGGPRPFSVQRPFTFNRPRFEGRGPCGYGPRGPIMQGGPFMQRPRGPVPLMELKVRPPPVSLAVEGEPKPSDEFGEEQEGLHEQGGLEEEEKTGEEFGEEQPYAGFGGEAYGIRPLGRPSALSGPRVSGEPWLREPGVHLRPRGPRPPDPRLQQMQRFPGPRGIQMVRGGRGLPGPVSRMPRPGFGEMSAVRGTMPGPRGPPQRFPRFGGPHFGEQQMGGFEADESFSVGEGYANPAEEDYSAQNETGWEQTDGTGNAESWQNEPGRHLDHFKPGDASTSSERDGGPSAGETAALKLFSEREHELIKKAAEELMQKKSLDIISKIISPSADKIQGVQSMLTGKDSQLSDDAEGFDDANLGEPHFETTEQPSMMSRPFSEDNRFKEGFDRPYPPDRDFRDERRPPPGGGGGFMSDRRLMDDRDLLEDRPFHDELARNRLFPPERTFPSDERRFPEDRPFLGDKPEFFNRDREFDRDLPPPHPFHRGRGPRDDVGFSGPPRDDMVFRGRPLDDPLFRGPLDERREFGGPPRPGFDMERRMFDERRPLPTEWEREDHMLHMGRGGRFPRPRDYLEGEDFPPPPMFGMGRGLRFPFEPHRGLATERAQVIDYGHGQQADASGADEFGRFRGEPPLRRDDNSDFDLRMDHDFRGHMPPDFRRGEGRPFPNDIGIEGQGPGLQPRNRSRSPPWPRAADTFGHERSPFDRMRDRGRDREVERFPPSTRGGFDGDRSRSHSKDLPEQELAFRQRDRDMDNFRNRPGPEVRVFPGGGDAFGRGPPRMPPPPVVEEIRIETVAVDDLLVAPGRHSRPDHMVVIVRGPPGAGKTYVSKLLKDKEVANGGTAPRMLCLDDYFVVEVEKVETDPETGKKVKKTVMEYEYDAAMEPSYHVSFLKNFKRQIDECYFNFIIVDAVFDKVAQLDEFWSYAKSKGFQVYVAEVHADVNLCIKRNTHQRKQPEIQKIIDGWEETPRHYIRLDIRSLLQDAAIEDVEMEDTTAGAASSGNEQKGDKTDKKDDDDDNDDDVEEVQGYQKSKWELDTSEQQLDKLDGIRLSKKKMDSGPQRLEDYLQLPDDYESRTRTSEPGKKRVRWADIEERKDQVRRRELGFVVGQTDWAKMTDESYAERALNRTKYI